MERDVELVKDLRKKPSRIPGTTQVSAFLEGGVKTPSRLVKKASSERADEMKLQFKHQEHQQQAVDAVVDTFLGQPKHTGISYRIDPGRRRGRIEEYEAIVAETGLANAELQLTDAQLLKNIHRVQTDRSLPLSKDAERSKAAPDAPNLDIEMETGTGKTYIYIKTIMELNRRYGWSKFIVVVPSVAIREGVKKSFDITAEHFAEEYGHTPRSFVYSSKQLHEVEAFSSTPGVQVMIINIQAFNSSSKDNRRIYDELDDFQSRRPIDVISANRPLVIIDEPQKISGAKSLQSLSRFNALAVLRYSATHAAQHNKVHRLDALDAYQQKLVKKIAVRGITVKGLSGSHAYLYVDTIEVRPGAAPRARVELEVRGKTSITRKVRWIEKGDRLYDLSGELEAYRDLIVIDIRATDDTVHLSSGDVVSAGQLTDTDVTENTKRRIQIREVIHAHLEKERELHHRGIKVLSLFFVGEVAKYRDYDREDTLGEYARIFEEEYTRAVDAELATLDLNATDPAYRQYLQRDESGVVHQGYFAVDKKTKQLKDPDKPTGESTDASAYDLILKDKERLLSLEEPVRFIFSHSALREGWDNPNVFTMGMLKKSDSTTTRRQEIGRGLRLAVDQDGNRQDDPDTVHDINVLTVVTDEAYTDFVTGLQKEYTEALAHRPRKASVEFFTDKELVNHNAGTTHRVTHAEAMELEFWLIQNSYIDAKRHLTDAWEARGVDAPPLPETLQDFHYQVTDLIDSLRGTIPPPPDAHRYKTLTPNYNFQKQEFQDLWAQINHKVVYQVAFDSAELISNAIRALNTQLRVTGLSYEIRAGEQRATVTQEQVASGASFADQKTRTEREEVSAGAGVEYDLIGEIASVTTLTRRTVTAILKGVDPGTFSRYRSNPEQFIAQAVRLIQEQKAAVVIEHLTYDTLAERHEIDIFTANQAKIDLSRAGEKLQKHIYDYVITDSTVERDFVGELDISSEVAVYAKLPRGFSIPTPMGNYNPDWAIAFESGSVKHIYFVAETKGTMSTMELKGVENTKVEAAREFFRALAERQGVPVKYGVVDSYNALMDIVT